MNATLRAALQEAGVICDPDDRAAVVRERLQARIIALAVCDPETFDRARFDRLMQLWQALADEGEPP